MKENKNQMEDFFKSSLDQFDQEPSDQVWAKVTDRLDSSEAPKGFVRFKKYLLRLLPILALVFIALYLLYPTQDNQNAEQIIASSETINNNNQALAQNKSIDQTYHEIKKESANKKAEAAIENNKTKPIKNEKNMSTTPIKQKNTRSESTDNITTDPENLDTKENVEISKPQLQQTKSKVNYPSINNSKSQGHEKVTNNNLDKKPIAKNSINTATSEIKNNTISTVKQESIFSVTEPLVVLNPQPLITFSPKLEWPMESLVDTTDHIQSSKASKYRFGINTRFFNTFLQYNSSFNGSESYGINQEYLIKKGLAITNSINYNVQHYDITMMGMPIDQAVVSKYTNRSVAQNNITRIESNSEFIDLDLGIKWNFNKRDSKTSFFVSPSVVWQLFLPQTFILTHTDNGDIHRNDQRLFLNFGSARLHLGLEKRLNNHMFYQFSIYGEQGFTTVGIEKRKIQFLGISNKLLFSI